jgi:hypothetical protein
MKTTLKFRNVETSPEDPVETWPFEGILAAVERGTPPDWRRLAKAISADPWGPVAQQVIEVLRLSRPYGTAELLEGVISRAREEAADSERHGWRPRSGTWSMARVCRARTSLSGSACHVRGCLLIFPAEPCRQLP